MPKFCEHKYYNRTEKKKKTFSYTLSVPRAIVEAVDLQNCDLIIGIKDGKIIIERKI